MADLNSIRRNSYGFSFIDKLGSFINNYEFKQGYDRFKHIGGQDKNSYIWSVLSALGDDYAETIYENVLNYLDNVANVDLCKVKSLQSMITILGIDYNVVNDIQQMPVEVINLVDILSINKKYLTDNKTFISAFYEQLSATGCIVASESESTLSDNINIDGPILADDGQLSTVHLSNYTELRFCLNETNYYNFLIAVYQQLLDGYIRMQYADAENGLSTAYTYIYEYIADRLTEKTTTTGTLNDKYEQQIYNLKLKYRLEDFNHSDIMDKIETGYDFVQNYNQYQQEVLSAEAARRNAVYPYEKTYNRYDKTLGYQVSRYSYYRERKVEEYFGFVQDTYNRLINSSVNDVYSILNDASEDASISVYEKDSDYFDINQKRIEYLLTYDAVSKQYAINDSYIYAIAEMLARQTLELADIRDQVKIQLRKSYLKGTFLLLSYIVNEYLKYNISKNFGDMIYDEEDMSLKEYINNSISNGDNIELVEYYDRTEYYNISASTDPQMLSSGISVINASKANDRFWEAEGQRIGVDTQDIPLEEIERFYVEQLKMKLNEVHTSSELVNFLSILYDYGANNTFLSGKTDKDFVAQVQARDLSAKQWIGDIDVEKDRLSARVELIRDLSKKVDEWVVRGYQLSVCPLSDQIDNLTSFASSYMFDKISSLNEPVRDGVQKNCEDYEQKNKNAAERLEELSVQYHGISAEEDYYDIYFKKYDPHPVSSYLIDKIQQMYEYCLPTKENPYGKNSMFHNAELINSLNTYAVDYIDLYDKLSNLIEFYVKLEQHWPSYSTDTRAEITAQTKDLGDYLRSDVERIQSERDQKMRAHFQAHLDKLLTYCESVNNNLALYNQTSAIFDHFKETIARDTCTDLKQAKTVNSYDLFTGNTWDEIALDNTRTRYYEYYVVGAQTAKAVTGTIEQQLILLQDRCQLQFPAKSTTYYANPELGLHYVCKVDVSGHRGGKALTVTAYSAQQQLWNQYWSDAIAANIRSSLRKCVNDFIKDYELINIELSCLDLSAELSSIDISGNVFYNPLNPINIPIKDLSPDTVGGKLSTLYVELLDRVQILDGTYIQREQSVSTDIYYKEYFNTIAAKLSAAGWILSSTPDWRIVQNESGANCTAYNIISIDTNFTGIEDKYQALKEKYGAYLRTCPDYSQYTLIKQFGLMSAWAVNFDRINQDVVLTELVSISSEYDVFYQQYKAETSFMVSSEVVGVDGALAYEIAEINFKYSGPDYAECLITAVETWLSDIMPFFDKTAVSAIQKKIPDTDEFVEAISVAVELRNIFASELYATDLIPDKLREYEILALDQIDFTESRRENYMAQKEIFLKYSGMDIGYDPFYNYKNITHASYQIHPDLYNFIKKSNIVYPLANTFFIAFTDMYDSDIVKIGLDNIIGKYGNQINLWKYGLFDWSGYQSQYEYKASTADTGKIADSYGFDGLFHPATLKWFLDDPEVFKQTVQDNRKESPYYRLNLTQEQLNKIVRQFEIYDKAIREVAQRARNSRVEEHSLQNEFDIYKYAQDENGNSLILIKSYKYLYDLHKDEPNYRPSYNEKKSAPGEMWMRVKNHPIAFPMFDLRESSIGYTQYNVDHEYITDIKNYFNNSKFIKPQSDVYKVTLDSISRTDSSARQNFRCFYDMELNPDKTSILLVVSYQTGTDHLKNEGSLDMDTLCYQNSNIVIGNLRQELDSATFTYEYYFEQYRNANNVEYVTNNVDNINPGLALVRPYVQAQEKYDFIGFAKNSNYVFAVFVHKYYYYNGVIVNKFARPRTVKTNPAMRIRYIGFNGFRIIRKTDISIPLKYDILYRGEGEYKYANNVVLSFSNAYVNIAYVSEQFQTVIPVRGGQKYSDDTTIVNHVEYTNMVESENRLCAYGMNIKYPSDTALLQTDDYQHINIYNSFDSFTSYIVNIQLRYNGNSMTYRSAQYYNINGDIGFTPLFADVHGKSRIYTDKELSSMDQVRYQMLGPENSDVAYTPVIIHPTDEKNGRVTEDWREYNKFTAYTPALTVGVRAKYTKHSFALRDIFVDARGYSTYDDLAASGQLNKYKWVFTNLTYPAVPVSRGLLKQPFPTDYYYESSEKYEKLSGQDIIGPNGVTYQDIPPTNHVDNISAINVEVKYDTSTLLPISVDVSCMVRTVRDTEMIIPENKFQLLVYCKNSLATYEYYHIIENAHVSALSSRIADPRITRAEENEIFFNQISCLSTYVTETGKKPFYNYSESSAMADAVAMLDFKYSEEDTIDREFPYINGDDIEDEVVVLNNEDQYIYFYASDCFDSMKKDVFYMEKYDTSGGKPEYTKVKINTASRKYQSFYDRAYTVQATYNVENIGPSESNPEYGIVLYLNYKNFTSPGYVKFKKRYRPDGTADVPETAYCSSTDEEIKNTYLVLKPGDSGRLDLRVDYVEYGKPYASDPGCSVIGKETRIIRSYYFMNLSDNKPKFIMSRTPFK